MFKEIQYIQNDSGEPTGVFIPIKKWNALKSKNKDLADLETKSKQKNNLLTELKEAIKELSDIEKGQKKSRPVKALLDEL
jgi:hypothetical protein